MKLEFSGLNSETWANINFRGIPSSGSRVVQRKQTARQEDRHRQIEGRRDMTKLIVAFRNFANAPTNKKLHNFQLNVTSFHVL
jgi:hypothetical protein